MTWVAVMLALGSVTKSRAAVACDFLLKGTPLENRADAPNATTYDAALQALDIDALQADVKELLTKSKECWPADYGNYGPLFVRLAWHCSGTYRKSDGKGGCGGGRQRFEPERSWPDNTNLDKARALLYPLKEKYGDSLSWGDLFVTAGSVALRSMGTPIKKMCFGRIDDADGTKSLTLGPTPEQEKVAPCKINGKCKEPLGSTTVGLIYLNPEGPVMTKDGKPNPDPALSAADIRDSFGRMGHSDRGTVALIGGGHAFGKTHGACPDGPGPSPREAFNKTPSDIPWPGLCNSGKGEDAFTAGFEGPWTTNPLMWDNEYFKAMLEHDWEKHIGPGGHWQWRIREATSPLRGLMRLTSDIALLHDEKYLQIVREFANNQSAFDNEFDDAWFKLTITNGNVWSKNAKCDTGPFPEKLHSQSGMLSNDAVII